MGKRIIKEPISDKIKEYNKLLVTEPNSERVKQLKADIDFFEYGIK